MYVCDGEACHIMLVHIQTATVTEDWGWLHGQSASRKTLMLAVVVTRLQHILFT